MKIERRAPKYGRKYGNMVITFPLFTMFATYANGGWTISAPWTDDGTITLGWVTEEEALTQIRGLVREVCKDMAGDLLAK